MFGMLLTLLRVLSKIPVVLLCVCVCVFGGGENWTVLLTWILLFFFLSSSFFFFFFWGGGVHRFGDGGGGGVIVGGQFSFFTFTFCSPDVNQTFQRNIKSEIAACGKEKKAKQKLEKLQAKGDNEPQVVSFWGKLKDLSTSQSLFPVFLSVFLFLSFLLQYGCETPSYLLALLAELSVPHQTNHLVKWLLLVSFIFKCQFKTTVLYYY